MSESGVTVKISYKTESILNESSVPLKENDLKGLIAVLRETQQKTNDCLTRLVEETGPVASTEENSSDQEDSSSDEDIESVASTDTKIDVSSAKRAKLPYKIDQM